MVTVENPIGTLSRVFHTHCTCACPSLSNACVQHSCTVIAALSGYAQQSFRCRTVIARPATCYVHDHLLSSGTVAWAAMPSLAHSAKHSRRTSFRCHRMFAPDFRKGVTQTDALQDYGVRFRAFGAAMKAKTASDAAARTPASTDGDAPNNSAEHEPSDARKIVNNIRQGTRTSAVLEKSGYHTMDEYCGSGLDIPGTVLCLTSTHSGLSLEAPTPSFWQLVCSLLHAAVAPQTGGRCRWCAASQYPWRCCRCRTSEGRPECGGNTLC
eukprot:m.442391 g.442391  ORF g.442391 m.442391 type:complete len:268 (+) comp21476_c0_seq3:1883-2686(+)